jgi:hypothetical protein
MYKRHTTTPIRNTLRDTTHSQTVKQKNTPFEIERGVLFTLFT